ncbi:GHMP family kinase ATP-binding protein [Neorhizobium sp. DT-125]|uniref:GHMP family kinase ATP-binding protein n=1 Tax=Neorhizobium sp. DT-125 TaxID=3396163 RepID=UPI003F1B1B87
MSFPNSFPFETRTTLGHVYSRPLRVGTGRASAHHGEILQGVFLDEAGRLHRALLTLPFPCAESIATFWPEDGRDIRTRPPGRSKAAKAAALTFQELGYSQVSGCLTIETSIPIGYGYGSSTADVVAAIRAAAAATGVELRRSLICRLAVEAETASDSIAFGERVVLFAHREGRVLEYFPGDYPPLYVVGFVSRDDPPVDTIAFSPAQYDSSEIESFRVLRGLARRAIVDEDASLLGHVATASARINQRHLPKKHFEELLRICEENDGCGVQVAHSGNLMGVLLDGKAFDAPSRAKRAATAAREAGFTDIVRFAVNADAMPVWG